MDTPRASGFNIGKVLAIAGVSLLTFYIGLHIYGSWNDTWNGYSTPGFCNIAVVPITGEIVTYGLQTPPDQAGEDATDMDTTMALIHQAEQDSSIEGILVRIDSPGGAPVAGQAIMRTLKRSTLPSAALIRQSGDSAAYQIATGADTIIASEYSDVGSIGVTMSYLDAAKQNEEQGLHYNTFSSGKFKDAGDPDKSVTAEERALFQRDVDILHKQFVKEVSENRNIPLADVAKLADGSSMAGSLALQNHLIDALGDQETARDWFATTLEISPDDVVFCE